MTTAPRPRPGEGSHGLPFPGARRRGRDATPTARSSRSTACRSPSRAGAVVGLVGPNGSGKTTLLDAVRGPRAPRAGGIAIAGAPAGSRAAREAVAIVPDEPTGLDELTVDEQIGCSGRSAAAGRPRCAGAPRCCSTSSGSSAYRGTSHGALSRGLRRRAAIVAALQLGAPLTLVDEATATLDPEAIVALDAALGALRDRGGAVLLATQDLHFAHRACDEIVLLAAGRVVAAGPPRSRRDGR